MGGRQLEGARPVRMLWHQAEGRRVSLVLTEGRRTVLPLLSSAAHPDLGAPALHTASECGGLDSQRVSAGVLCTLAPVSVSSSTALP